MVKIYDKNGKKRFSVSTNTHRFLMRCRDKIQDPQEDNQMLGAFWGKVGCGKSLTAQHFAYIIDPTLSISRICFNKEEFINAVLDNKRKVIIGDEGISLFFTRNVMTKDGRLMSEIMDQIRQKNLCVFICVPKLLSIDRDILSEVDFVAHVWESRETIDGNKVTVKGNVAFYPRLKGKDYAKNIIRYLRDSKANKKHKFKQYPAWMEKGTRIMKTTKAWFVTGEAQYRRKKESILDKYRQTNKQTRVELIKEMKNKNPALTDEMIAKSFGLRRETVNRYRNQGVSANEGKY